MRLYISSDFLACCFLSVATLVQVPAVIAQESSNKMYSKVDDDAPAADAAYRRSLRPQTRIIGGDQAEKGEFPYYGESPMCIKMFRYISSDMYMKP